MSHIGHSNGPTVEEIISKLGKDYFGLTEPEFTLALEDAYEEDVNGHVRKVMLDENNESYFIFSHRTEGRKVYRFAEEERKRLGDNFQFEVRPLEPEKLEVILQAEAPVRVDFAGGTLDIAPVIEREGETATLNAAIELPVYVILKKAGLKGIFLQSIDQKRSFYAENSSALKYDGNLDLLKAVIKQFGDVGDLYIETKATVPPGAGLGSSAAIAVALTGLLNRKLNRSGNVVNIAHKAESEELHIVCGKQDQYAAAIGGINLWKFYPDGRVERNPVKLSQQDSLYLEERLVLCYTGISRLSGDANAKMILEYVNGVNTESMKGILQVTLSMYEAMLNSRFDEVAKLMNEETGYRCRLHPDIGRGVDGKYGEVRRIGLEHATAAKIMGAGAGGCLLFYVEPEKRDGLVKALETTGSKIIPVHFNHEGLVVK